MKVAKDIKGYGSSTMYGLNGQVGWLELIKHTFMNEPTRHRHMVANRSDPGDTLPRSRQKLQADIAIGWSFYNKAGGIVVAQVGSYESSIRNGDEDPITPLPMFQDELLRFIEDCKTGGLDLLLVGMQPVDETRTTPCAIGKATYTNSRRQQYLEAEMAIADRERIRRIDIWDALGGPDIRKAGFSSERDGIHMNDAGHARIASLVMPELRAMLPDFSAPPYAPSVVPRTDTPQ